MLSNTKSQKALDTVEDAESVSQWMSGKLKSPTTIVSEDGSDCMTCIKIETKILIVGRSLEPGGM